LYSKKLSLSKADIIDLSQQWIPYRTVATWYLWRSLDPVPVQY
ncbi:MAG: DNA-3-methyladenine glycosylase 2 family protein, partial [cyanobacterium endosymbiont of Rhopalodia inflata]